MSIRGMCVAWGVAAMVSAGSLSGQIPANPLTTNFTTVHVATQDAGCVWRDKQTHAESSNQDGPRVRRTLFGFLGSAEAASTTVSEGLLEGQAYAYDATLNDSGAAASASGAAWSVDITRVRACSNPQPVVSINYSTSFRGIARVDGATSHAHVDGSLVAKCSELAFTCSAGGRVEAGSVATAIGSVPVQGIPVPIIVSSSSGPVTMVFNNQDNQSRAGITYAKLVLQAKVNVSARADAMLGFFKTVAEAYIGNHVVAFEFTGRCNSCGGRIDVTRT